MRKGSDLCSSSQIINDDVLLEDAMNGKKAAIRAEVDGMDMSLTRVQN